MGSLSTRTRRTKKEWEETTLKPALKRYPEREARFETVSGIEVDALYTPEDMPDFDYERDLGYPGQYPFTRGVQPNTYRGRVWTMRQYSGYATAEESNRRYRYLMKHGQTGLSVAFDLPTQMGYDSDHLLARGEVGKVGVPICTLADMEALFKGIPLDKVSTSMTINATAPILLAFYIAVAKKQGVDISRLDGTVQNDILKEYIARGTYIFPPRPSMRLITDVFRYCTEHLPSWNTISISGYHMREAGATAVQELAFTFANAIEYVQAAVSAGLDVDSFAGRLSFFFVSHNNLFEEAAKFRAARRIWAKIMREHFGAKNPRSWMLRFHTQTAGVTLTAQQPENNVVRATVQSLAAILGGTQSLHTCSKDEALSLPSEEAVQLSLRTQQVLAHESGVTETVDPLAGSYYVEHLTNTLERETNKYLKRIEDLGGATAAIEKGFQQREIQESSYRFQKDVESGKHVIVGINKYTSPYPPMKGLFKLDPAEIRKQIEGLNRVRKERDKARVEAGLAMLEKAARGTENTMPIFVECAEAYATIGEMCDVLRGVFGAQREFLVF
ncbi:MAG: methylmalonyl-CoA mutase family protein [Chloroflexi bacterium]|nr:methylmalonyl-CoA mutase family protein [Chloroflexota bacterium]